MTQPTTANAVPYGGYVLSSEPVSFNTGRPVTRITVKNTGDRPIQVGSHFHFFEVNSALAFDRGLALGQHLNITATTAVRFEPGDEIDVELIPFGGERTLLGFNNLVDLPGPDLEAVINDPVKRAQLVSRAADAGFKHTPQC